MKKISYAPKNVLLIAFCVSLFGISVYATTRSGSNAIDSRASGHVDWSKVYPWKETTDLSSLPGNGEFQSLSERVQNDQLVRTLFRGGRLFSQTVPLSNGIPLWSSAAAWRETTDLSSLPGNGEFQSLSERVQNDQLVRTLFRGGRLFSQTVPLSNGIPLWSSAAAWRETTDLSSLPGNGTIQQLSEYVVQGKTLIRHLFRNNKLYVQEVPFVDNSIRWNNASDWRETADTTTLPGSGSLQSLTERIQGDFLVRTLLRGGRMFTQTVPLENGIPHWSAVHPWKTHSDLSSLPGSGEIQSLSEYSIGNTLYRTLVRNARMFTQSVSIDKGTVRWSSASVWREITDLSSLPGSGEIQSLSEYSIGNTLYRTLVRNARMFTQSVSIDKGTVRWSSASVWREITDLSSLPGSGEIQSLSEYSIGNTLYRTLIRNGVFFHQALPVRNGAVVWTGARDWKEQIDMTTVPGNGVFQAMSEYQLTNQLIRTIVRNDVMYSQSVPIRE